MSLSANTPQAKGRVERVNKTLQDRLVKELRLKGMSDMETANDFLPLFIADYNKKFAVEASCPGDVHRHTLPDKQTLTLIFSEQYGRQISKNLEVSFQNKIYQIDINRPGYTMRRAPVTVCVDGNHDVKLLYKNKLLPYHIHEKRPDKKAVLR